MKYVINILALIATLTIQAYGQNSINDFDKYERGNFTSIRKEIRRLSEGKATSVEQIADFINSVCSSDLDKAYAAYYWVSTNITYDMKALKAKQQISDRPSAVLRTKLAVCSGYAHLLNSICTELTIRSKIVDGYSKGYGYAEGDNFTMSNHSWNLILINNRWYPVDATWASPNNNSEEFSNYNPDPLVYFMPSPKTFIIDHLPEDPQLQLLSPIITLDLFEKSEKEIKNQIRYALVINKNEDSYLNYEDIAAHEVAMKERALAFNPNNKQAVYKLGLALLYQALDTMETIQNLRYDNVLEELPKYKYRTYELLDKAAHHFEAVTKSSGKELYESAQSFLQEVTYQKGVFNYEASQIIYDKTLSISREDILPRMDLINKAMNQYYDIAMEYFNTISSNSWYFEDSQHYIQIINQERDNTLVK